MEIEGRYWLSAENLALRNKNRLSEELDGKEKETEELFYWILSRIEWDVQKCWPAKRTHSVTVKEAPSSAEELVLLEHGRIAQYMSQYVSRNSFYAVMQKVCDIFNGIGVNKKEGFSYEAMCYIAKNSASMTVTLITND